MSFCLKVVTSIMLVLSLCACSNMRKYTMPDEDTLLSGAGSMLIAGKEGKGSAESFEQINMDDLLQKYGFFSFPNEKLMPDDPRYQYLRNELQDRIIAASNQRCGTYLRILVASKAQTKMGWAGLATLLSGAASVVSPVAVAKALAAGSAVSNGVLSLYNEAYFNNLALNVISAGITRQRQALLEQLTIHRRASDLTAYPVNRAISDALAYHAACNIISGLETAVVATRTASSNTVLSIVPNEASNKLDSKEAITAWRNTADKGDKVAMYMLGRSYAKDVGVATSEEQAIYWWGKAAEGKDPDPGAVEELKKRGLR